RSPLREPAFHRMREIRYRLCGFSARQSHRRHRAPEESYTGRQICAPAPERDRARDQLPLRFAGRSGLALGCSLGKPRAAYLWAREFRRLIDRLRAPKEDRRKSQPLGVAWLVILYRVRITTKGYRGREVGSYSITTDSAHIRVMGSRNGRCAFTATPSRSHSGRNFK